MQVPPSSMSVPRFGKVYEIAIQSPVSRMSEKETQEAGAQLKADLEQKAQQTSMDVVVRQTKGSLIFYTGEDTAIGNGIDSWQKQKADYDKGLTQLKTELKKKYANLLKTKEKEVITEQAKAFKTANWKPQSSCSPLSKRLLTHWIPFKPN